MAPSTNPESQLDPALAGLSTGSRVGGGRFSLLRVLGHGGMGVVWLARDEHLQEDVALKFLPPEIRHDAAALDDLRRETSRSRKLTNPHILRIHDLYKSDHEAFISMEYVEGLNLTERRLQQPDRVLSWSFLEPLVRQLCDALAHAHGENIVHRDLKPANMMLDGRGRLKLADFGIAATVSDSISRISMARHSLSGTASYMSPQQLDGQLPQITDDIYSVGSTLYELLTSRAPFFTGDIPHQVRALPAQPIEKRLSQLRIENPIPRAVGDAIMRCLCKDPDERPQSAAALAEQLGLSSQADKTSVRPQQGQTPVDSTAVSPPPAGAETSSAGNTRDRPPFVTQAAPASTAPFENVPATGRRRRIGAIATAALVLIALAVAAPLLRRARQAKEPSAKAAAPPAAPEFISIFNGYDFTGWDGDTRFWSIKDGAIVGNSTPSKEPRSRAVVWKGGTVEDFELRLSFRLETGNSGIYYRGRKLPGNEVAGYQCEIVGDYTGQLIERGTDRLRRHPSRRGSVVIANVADGKETIQVEGPTGSTALEIKDAFRQTGWNDLVIIARGNHLIHQLNGHTIIETVDQYDQRPRNGVLALEVYGREPTIVHFRDLRLKQLTSTPTPAVNSPAR
jgi:serine/threonine protein kinase